VQPLVAVFFIHWTGALSAVATEERSPSEAQLFQTDYLHSKAALLNAPAVVLAQSHSWETDPLLTCEEVVQTLKLFDELRDCGVQVVDHIILGKDHDSRPMVFSFLLHGMLPTKDANGEWVWGEYRYP
jgi:hypothetical protein